MAGVDVLNFLSWNRPAWIALVRSEDELNSFERDFVDSRRSSISFDPHFLNPLTSAQLISVLHRLPPSIQYLEFSFRALGEKPTAEVIEIVRAIPDSVRQLILAESDLGKKSISELLLILQALPSSIIHLDLRGNGFYCYQAEGKIEKLIQFLRGLPMSIQSLNIGEWELTNSSELKAIFEAIPKGLVCLDLGNAMPAFRWPSRKAGSIVIEAASALPSWIKYVNVSYWKSLEIGSKGHSQLVHSVSPSSICLGLDVDYFYDPDPPVWEERAWEERALIDHAASKYVPWYFDYSIKEEGLKLKHKAKEKLSQAFAAIPRALRFIVEGMPEDAFLFHEAERMERFFFRDGTDISDHERAIELLLQIKPDAAYYEDAAKILWPELYGLYLMNPGMERAGAGCGAGAGQGSGSISDSGGITLNEVREYVCAAGEALQFLSARGLLINANLDPSCRLDSPEKLELVEKYVETLRQRNPTATVVISDGALEEFKQERAIPRAALAVASLEVVPKSKGAKSGCCVIQ